MKAVITVRYEQHRGYLDKMKRSTSDDKSRPVMTVDQAAKLLGIGRMSAYLAVQRGDIKSIRVGRRILVLRSALDKLLQIGC